MKKILKKLVLASFVCLSPLSLIACHNDPKHEDPPCVNPVEEYTVSFNTLGGTTIQNIKGEAGTAFSMPADPVKNYFTFAGWFEDKACTKVFSLTSIPEHDVVVYAKWVPVASSVISFETNGGSSIAEIHGSNGDAIVLPENPTKPGFKFAGWYLDQNLATPFTATKFDSTDKTLYAKWQQNDGEYSVTYHVANKVVEELSEDGKLAFNNDLLPEGTVLDGWYLDEACTKPAVSGAALTESIHLYASFYTEGLKFADSKVVSYSGSSSTVYLPASINGNAITEIGEAAFYGNKTMTVVYIPSTVKTIAKYAFYKCENLTSASLPTALTAVGDYAFFNCKRLKTIDTLGNTQVVGAGAFTGCEILLDFTMSPVLKKVNAHAFAGCQKLTTLAFPDSLETLGDYALSQCTNLKSLSLGKSFANYGEEALSGVDALEAFTLSSENTSFVYENDSFMNAAKTTLYKYFGDAKVYVAPSTVTLIKANAFSGNATITEINISTVANVEMGCLAGMKSLEKLTLKDLSESYIAYYFGASKAIDNGAHNAYVPASLNTVVFTNEVTNISAYAFYGINSLKNVEGIANVVAIDEYAFAYTDLTSFTISSLINSIDSTAFYASSVKEFKLASTNSNYTVVNGCVYNANGTTLEIVPAKPESIVFPDTLTTLKANVFNGVEVDELTIPRSVTSIERGALYGINGLKCLTAAKIGDGNDNYYMHYLFGSTMTIEEVTNEDGSKTNKYSFDNLDYVPTSLAKIVLTGTDIKIPEFSFAYFEGLAEIVLPSTVTEIGDYAFARCAFVNVDIPATITTLGSFAYAYNFDLKTVSVASATIGDAAFGYCLNLSSVAFKDGVTAIPEYCFMPYSETSSTTNEKNYYSNLADIEIASSVKSIGKAAFLYAGYYGTSNTHTLNIKFTNIETSQLETVGLGAFEGSSLVNITLPASVTTLEQEAFAFCDNLASVTFGNKSQGSKLATIGEIAFANDSSLESVYIYKNVASEADLPQLLTQTQSSKIYYPFVGVGNKVKVYVPASSVQFYKQSQDYISAGLASVITAITE